MSSPLIITQGLILIPIKAMYAIGATKQLLKISSTTIILNVVLNYALLEWMGYPGVALSSSLVSFYYITLVSRAIYKEMPDGEAARLIQLIRNMILPMIVMAVPILLIQFFTPIEQLYSLYQLSILVPIGALFYGVGLYLFYREGFYQILEVVRKRKSKKA